ncbi:PE-PPE domain-containing protein [Nocardia sp. NPDC056100]|uniref:PE-PPE domain-containing protein n=1 Tax=Nocardia sp. NPDC056100 TaxID=3345712 RepID=UPI0035D70517
MITVLTCRGTGERLGAPENMLAQVTLRLDSGKYRIGPDVDYPASIGPANPQNRYGGCSEEDSIVSGVAALVSAIREAPDRVGILGYSLGAEVVSRFLEAKARGEYADCEVAWAANIANPMRMQGDSIDANAPGFGINGEHGPWPEDIPTWEAANPSDGIPCCPADSPLRALADTVSAFSFAQLGGWGAGLVEKFRGSRWQPGAYQWRQHPIRHWRLWTQAADLMQGYLSGGAHNAAYRTGGYCDRLAEILNAHGDPRDRPTS